MDNQHATCADCGHRNDEDNLFCGRCGTTLNPCVRCGLPNQAADTFCRTCGTSLTSSQAVPDSDVDQAKSLGSKLPSPSSDSTSDWLRPSSAAHATDRTSPTLPLQSSPPDQRRQEPATSPPQTSRGISHQATPTPTPQWIQSSTRANTVFREPPPASLPSRARWQPTTIPVPSTVDVAERPVWLVVALTVLTLGLYQIVWLGMTWAQMKRELQDDSMRPWGHALSLFVPIYGWTRVHAHYRTINELLGRVGKSPRLSAGLATTGWVIANVVGASSGRQAVPAEIAGWMVFVSAALAAFVVGRGQAGLNAYWTSSRFRNVSTRVHWGEWVGLATVVLLLTVLLFGGARLGTESAGLDDGSTVVVNEGPDGSLIGYVYLQPYPFDSGVSLDRVSPGNELRITSASGYNDPVATDSATGITYWHVVIPYSGVEGWIDADRLTITD